MLFLITNNAFLKAIYTFPMTFYYIIQSCHWFGLMHFHNLFFRQKGI